ncbi:MAG: citrate synthase [Chitinophagales bacterium]|nr:citrate synthase [Chitinophagales bacterium]
MSENIVTIQLDGKEINLPVIIGTENEKALDIAKLRAESGYITLDTGYKNTGATSSAITFLNGEEGILHYRGYDIADLAENASFTEVSYLLLYGELPSAAQLAEFEASLSAKSNLPNGFADLQKAFPSEGHPMSQLAAGICLLSNYYKGNISAPSDENIHTIIGAFAPVAANIQRNFLNKEFVPSPGKGLVHDFLTMAFGEEPDEVIVDAMDKLLILHADHEQNCSTSTVRMVGSSHANVFASITGGINALWGPLHGGANQSVLEMLEAIKADGGDIDKYVAKAKDKDDPFRLMGFGHRVYKNFDPRAKIIKKAADNVLNKLGVKDETLSIAKKLEEIALSDPYFVERNLYPNVDFYSGIIYKAIGFPTEMFTVLFALGRIPGWVSNWKEMLDRKEPIGRPRQVYTGATLRKYVPISER